MKTGRSDEPEAPCAEGAPRAKADDRLREALDGAAPDDRIEALLVLRPDATRAHRAGPESALESAEAPPEGLTRAEQRRYAAERLRAAQEASLGGVLGRLREAGVEVLAGGKSVAALHVRGSAEALRKALDDDDVTVGSWEQTIRARSDGR